MSAQSSHCTCGSWWEVSPAVDIPEKIYFWQCFLCPSFSVLHEFTEVNHPIIINEDVTEDQIQYSPPRVLHSLLTSPPRKNQSCKPLLRLLVQPWSSCLRRQFYKTSFSNMTVHCVILKSPRVNWYILRAVIKMVSHSGGAICKAYRTSVLRVIFPHNCHCWKLMLSVLWKQLTNNFTAIYYAVLLLYYYFRIYPLPPVVTICCMKALWDEKKA